MTDQPSIVQRDATPTAVVRSTEALDALTSFYDRAYQAVDSVLREQGVEPGEAFGLYLSMHDNSTELEAGFTVDRVIEGSGEVIASELPAGEYATITHVGPYDTLPDTWQRLGAWVTGQGHTPAREVFEVYVSDPTSTPPEELRTDLFWSIDR
jgi:effector-binding domain-containing protein